MGATIHRRQMLRISLGAGVLTVLGCSDDGSGDASTGDASIGDATTGSGGVDPTTGHTTTGDGTCEAIPEETAGPYPGDGTNGANALTLADIVRSDIRSSIGDASGTADGVPLTIELTLLDEACNPLAGHAIYLWHCDRNGDYSLYTGAAKAENYLRGVQVTDADGKLSFQSIFPACYSGRWPHIHFEVFPSLASASEASNKLATSQLALPEDTCDDVFATAGYEDSIENMNQITFASDNVFNDGVEQQLAEISGSIAGGLVAALTFTIKA